MRLNRWLLGLTWLVAMSLLACSGGGGGTGTTSFAVTVQGTPSNVKVFVNGVEQTNPNRIELPAGVHTIRVETTLSNGQVVAQTFTVVAGSVNRIEYDLNQYRIVTNPTAVEVWAGETVQVAASLRDQNNNPVSATFTWSVRNPNIASVNSSGVVRGIALGSTRLVIMDVQRGLSVEVPITVLDFPPPPN
ncbi:MAG: Ig-like domain-containing protein [Fimbriimonadales bacterium]